MADIISRAGPFANSDLSFISFEDNEVRLPVNCANNQGATWPWRWGNTTDGSMVETAPTSGEINESQEVDGEFDPIAGVTIQFGYQASQPWSFESANMSASIPFGFAELRVERISFNTSGGGNFTVEETYETQSADTSQETEPPAIASVEFDLSEVVFPASVVPVFINLSVVAGRDGSPRLAQAAISIQLGDE